MRYPAIDGKSITEKDAKINWLTKLLQFGEQIDCRPTKIVAGHEPEKTNYFLQQMFMFRAATPQVLTQRVLEQDKCVLRQVLGDRLLDAIRSPNLFGAIRSRDGLAFVVSDKEQHAGFLSPRSVTPISGR